MPKTAHAAVRALVGVLLVLGVVSVVTFGGSGAGAATTAWTAAGPTATVVSDGSDGTPTMRYSDNPAGFDTVSWTFQTVADADGTVVMPYDYSGLHAYFDVDVALRVFVTHDGATSSSTLVSDHAADGNSGPPSGGFHYTGTTQVTVQAGDTYGFVASGRNFDYNNYLAGTLVIHLAGYTDPAQVAENTSWPNAALLTTSGTDDTITADGQARWYKFPIVPSSSVRVSLSHLAQNYDLTLYSDIGARFTQLTSTTDLNTLGAEQVGNAYAPSIYSPSIYSPSIYSPSIYSPSIYSPSIYSPSIYSPSIYSPSIYSPSIYSPSIYSPSIYSPSIYSPSIYSPSDAFLQAFSDAQARSLLGVSAQDGFADESINAATYNNTGFFYVRVQGRNGVSSPTPFRLGLATSGGPCSGITLNSYAGDATLRGTPGAAADVILYDSSRLAPTPALTTDMGRLASATNGVLVDVSGSARVNDLNAQADANPGCPYAKNLVAQAIRDIVNSYRDANGTLTYVTILGGDSSIPFFRYADTAGLGPETNYVPPVLGTSASQGSLQGNQVLGQDAYGTVSDLSLKGTVLPVPDLAVGRLVETAGEIDGQIAQFLALNNKTLPTPTSSLVTGYDFLTSAADAVQADLQAGLGSGGRTDTLITNQGVPTTTTTGSAGPSRTTSWTASDLSKALFGSRHDIVFLAGHFSANSTLAADYATSLVTTDVAQHPNAFTNALVFSAGCHSGYNLVDGDGVPGLTLGLDWAQEMAQQKAVLIAGTGYQYADTNFLAFSAKLYTLFADELRAGQVGTPVAIGQALVRAKQDYLESLSTVGGIDQKSLLESTMYGLPMTGLDLPSGRTGFPTTSSTQATDPVTAGTPGDVLGLRTAAVSIDASTTSRTSPVVDVNGNPTGANYSWLTGPDGVVTQPALPTLPEQIIDATSDTGASLRGVGFRSGTYTDTAGVTPLTGAPATEQNGIHTSFASPQFWPQNLATVNYFDALGGSNSGGRTRVVITPAQYRSEPGTSTDTLRRYSQVGVKLFYSKNIATYGQNTPALAQAPSISQVAGVASSDGHSVDLAVHVTGDPSAGIQQVWVTYTGEAGPFHGSWNSIDLTQDVNDSTLWHATLALPSGQDPNDVRFLVQAVNGVGAVGVDNNLGAGYTPGVIVGALPPSATATSLQVGSVASSVSAGSTLHVTATLTGAPAGSTVGFDLGQGPVTATTDAAGTAAADLLVAGTPGTHQVTVAYAGDGAHLPSGAHSTDFTVVKAPTTVTLTATKPTTTESTSGPKPTPPAKNIATWVTIKVASGALPLGQRSVRIELDPVSGGATIVVTRTTGPDGIARLGTVTIAPGQYVVTAVFGTSAAGTAVDPAFDASSAQKNYVLNPAQSIELK